MVRYSRPYLKTVIVRLDFASSIDKLLKYFPKVLEEAVKPSFPISEPREFISKEVNIKINEATKERVQKGTEWVFYSNDKLNTLSISSKYLVISYNSYPSYEVLKQNFLSIAQVLFGTFDQIQGRRFGLRYINEIYLEESNTFDWTRYINSTLLTNITFPEGSDSISKINNSIEFNFHDSFMRLMYGISNPDYPAVIRKKIFTLDYDAYCQGPQDFND